MVLLSTLIFALAAPFKSTAHPLSFPYTPPLLTPRSPLGNGVPLRIMPLGASITYGTASSDGNGYRSALRTRIISTLSNSTGPAAGPTVWPGSVTGAAHHHNKVNKVLKANQVNMVGSRRAGTMTDNDVEGWPGLRIDEVRDKARASLPRCKPNVVLVNAGTNDALQGHDVKSAGARMEGLLGLVWGQSPRAVVVLSTLLPNRDVGVERNVGLVNRQYRELVVRLREREGHKIVLAEMHGQRGLEREELADGTHPTDVGYRKMAEVWYAALVEASALGWLQPPETVDGEPEDGALRRLEIS
ncbi:carbohydrate esterase family 3 protein [Parathielavia hyrcaniae]|uniref:Carbohydrate esterase family 3 protein n=1 Tax=Parathielavia hyrcaniae TaxID=113614 RepID=A0AAN6SWV8_9PEZI|nr:carbohydrate esterase family 3 protein [Parathielavia hyrcaniae]